MRPATPRRPPGARHAAALHPRRSPAPLTRRVAAAASDADDPPLASTLDALCDAALAGAVDSVLLDLVPDEAFSAAADRWEARVAAAPRAPPRPLADDPPPAPGPSFLDVVTYSPDIAFDAAALRGLILAPPRAVAPTAALRPTPGRAVVRLAITAHAGEEVTLVLTLSAEERATAHYKAVRAVRRWALASARGEARDGAPPPTALHPSHSPEAVLRACLDALATRDGAVAGALLARAPAGSAAAKLAAAAAGAGAPPAGLDVLLAPGVATDILSVRMLTRDAALAVVGAASPSPDGDDEGGALFDGRGRRLPPPPSRRAALVWRLGLQSPGGGPPPDGGDACWGVEGVELAGGWAADGGSGMLPWPVG